MNAIEIKGLTKRYKDTVAVDGVSLDIRENELFGLLGVNGAGKTTLIKMLACLLAPDGGEGTVMGLSIAKDAPRIKALIGYSTQETAVAKNLSVRENLAFYGSLYGLGREEVAKRTEALIARFSLEKVADKRVGKLSGGYQRKVSIALAIISEPKILFLDEPTLGLDVLARRELWRIIRDIQKNTTVILTTHYLEEAEALSDRVAIMVEGRLLDVDTPRGLIAKTGADSFEDAFIKTVGGGKDA
ncbi:MAG: ABC transporter ATP-binding protein [Clostridia bacterium]|nr:ABC transporter ATP-binding protein [Clostridia bacterium]